MSKIHHTKKVFEDMNILRKKLRVRQEVSDEIKTSIFLIEYDLQSSIGKNIYCKKAKENLFWLNWDGLRKLFTMNPMEKQITKRNTTSENITYLVENKTNLYQNKNCTH